MPRGDGTGPLGQGAMTGRGMGTCCGTGNRMYGRGLGQGRGPNCRLVNFNAGFSESFESLTQQKAALEDRLNAINKKLNK